MIENLQKGFDNLFQEIFSIKTNLFKYNSRIDRFESVVFYNETTKNTNKYDKNQDYEMAREDEDHDSNATETPTSEKNKQYFQYLSLTRPDLINDESYTSENQPDSAQERILKSLENLTKQFYNFQNDNYQLKREIFKNKSNIFFLNPSSTYD